MQNNTNELFKICKLEHYGGLISAVLDINKDSDIFNGHFPGQPVIPGACMLQIVKEVLESALTSSFRLKKADHLKFILFIDPSITHSVLMDLSYKQVNEDTLNVTAKLINGEVICFKFQGIFIKQ